MEARELLPQLSEVKTGQSDTPKYIQGDLPVGLTCEIGKKRRAKLIANANCLTGAFQ